MSFVDQVELERDLYEYGSPPKFHHLLSFISHGYYDLSPNQLSFLADTGLRLAGNDVEKLGRLGGNCVSYAWFSENYKVYSSVGERILAKLLPLLTNEDELEKVIEDVISSGPTDLSAHLLDRKLLMMVFNRAEELGIE